MKTKLPFLCLFLVGALAVTGCAGLASNSTGNFTATNNEAATDNLTAVEEPSTPETPAAVSWTPLREGWEKPRELTPQEQQRAVRIAFTVRELEQRLQDSYQTKMVWFVKTAAGWTVTTEPMPYISDALGFYPGVSISFGPYPEIVFDVAVDLDAGIPVRFKQSTAEEHFLPRLLTEEEKAAAIKVALSAIPPDYQVDPDEATFIWLAITPGGQTGLDYDIVDTGFPPNAPLNADYYPGVVFRLAPGHPMTVVVDLRHGKALQVLGPFPVPLTADEEAKFLRIASQASGGTFAKFVWVGITPDGQMHTFDYQNVNLGVPYWSSKPDMTFYLGAIFPIEPAAWIATVVLDFRNGKVERVDTIPNLSSPNRFRRPPPKEEPPPPPAQKEPNPAENETETDNLTPLDNLTATNNETETDNLTATDNETEIARPVAPDTSASTSGNATLTVTTNSWTAPEPLTSSNYSEVRSSLLQDNAGNFRCAFTGKPSNAETIYWSMLSGAGWTPPEAITPAHSASPSLIQDSAGNFQMAFSHYGDTIGQGPHNIYLATNDGEGWTPPVRITTYGNEDMTPSLAEDANGDLHIVFQRLEQVDAHHSAYHLFWTTYHNGTDNVTWSSPVPITDQSSAEIEPSLITDASGNLVLVFTSQTEEYGSVKMMTYSDEVWSAPVTIYSRPRSEGTPWGTSLAQAKDGTLWVAFAWEPNGIYVMNNSGGTWSAPNWAVMPTPEYDSSYPSLVQDTEGYLRISFRYWDHAGDREIYWTKSKEPSGAAAPE
ncbi:exo-alpha-sialidase [Chloroflexota bacterium]